MACERELNASDPRRNLIIAHILGPTSHRKRHVMSLLTAAVKPNQAGKRSMCLYVDITIVVIHKYVYFLKCLGSKIQHHAVDHTKIPQRPPYAISGLYYNSCQSEMRDQVSWKLIGYHSTNRYVQQWVFLIGIITFISKLIRHALSMWKMIETSGWCCNRETFPQHSSL